jgi:hypothetical protein
LFLRFILLLRPPGPLPVADVAIALGYGFAMIIEAFGPKRRNRLPLTAEPGATGGSGKPSEAGDG